MEGLIFAVLSLLVLFLVLYLLPFGLTVKGKVLVAVIAFLIGTVGFLLESFLPLWQIGLLLLVFVVVTAYLVNKRDVDWLFQSEEGSNNKKIEEDKEQFAGIEMNGAYNHIARSDHKSGAKEILLKKQKSNKKSLSAKLNQQNGNNTYEEAQSEHNQNEQETMADETDLTNLQNTDRKVFDEELHPGNNLVVDDPDIEALLHEAATSAQNDAQQRSKLEERLDYLTEFEDSNQERAIDSQKSDLIDEIPTASGEGFDLEEIVLEPIVVKEEEPIIPPANSDDDFEIETIEFIDRSKEKERTQGQEKPGVNNNKEKENN